MRYMLRLILYLRNLICTLTTPHAILTVFIASYLSRKCLLLRTLLYPQVLLWNGYLALEGKSWLLEGMGFLMNILKNYWCCMQTDIQRKTARCMSFKCWWLMSCVVSRDIYESSGLPTWNGWKAELTSCAGYMPRCFISLQTVAHLSAKHVIVTRLKVKPTMLKSQVQHLNYHTTKPPGAVDFGVDF